MGAWRRGDSALTSPRLAIVVPTWNEAPGIAALAAHLALVAPEAEVLLVDGSSDDGTASAARAVGLRVLSAPRGRAAQMNAGAAASKAQTLLFLHADTRLPGRPLALIEETLADSAVALGAFGFRFAQRGRRLRFVEAGAQIRSRWFGVPYGDQGLFLRRDTFEALGGFADLPLGEDFDLVVRARRRGRVVVRREAATTSARRYEEHGVLRQMARTSWLGWRLALGWRPGAGERAEPSP